MQLINHKKIKTIFYLAAMISAGFSGAVSAGDMGEHQVWEPLLGLSVGPAWVSAHQNQMLTVQPDVQKAYIATHSNNTFVMTDLFLGGQKQLQSPMFTKPVMGQLGVVVAWAGDADISGHVWEDANPNFNNYDYAYKLNHTYVALKGRFLGQFEHIVEPYVSGSLGLGFNRAYNYKETAKIPEEVPAPGFEAHTKTTFSYTLGVGLQKAFMGHIQAAVGYEFSDWGQSQLARAPGQTLNQGLSSSHTYAQYIRCSLFTVL